MFFAYSSQVSQAVGKSVAWKFASAGSFLAGVGTLILLFPLLLAMIVAGLCFSGALLLFGFAWKVWRATPPAEPTGREYSEATWRELP